MKLEALKWAAVSDVISHPCGAIVLWVACDVRLCLRSTSGQVLCL